MTNRQEFDFPSTVEAMPKGMAVAGLIFVAVLIALCCASCVATTGQLQDVVDQQNKKDTAIEQAHAAADQAIAHETAMLVAAQEDAPTYVAHVAALSVTPALAAQTAVVVPPSPGMSTAQLVMLISAISGPLAAAAGVAVNAYRNSTSAQRTSNELAQASVGTLPTPTNGLPPVAAVVAAPKTV